jgi:hypothetical protein
VKGAIVQTVKRVLGPPPVKRGRRGRVVRQDGDFIVVEMAEGGRFEAHLTETVRLLRKDIEIL